MGFSKSQYTRGLQCPKILWMDAHMPEAWREDLTDTALKTQGGEVGELAKRYFGEPDLSLDHADGFEENIRLTQRAIAERPEGRRLVICEATFGHEGCLCMVDVLLVEPDGALRVFEVKSSTHVKPYHVQDAAFQAWVLASCGYEVAQVSIMHVDKAYERAGDIDPRALFKAVDVTEEAARAAARVPSAMARFEEVKGLREEPTASDMARAAGCRPLDGDHRPITAYPGAQCASPHKCGYFGHCCLDALPERSVFTLQGASRANCLKDLERGIVTVEDALARKGLKGFKRCQAAGRPRVNREGLARHLAKYRYPLYMLDFETVNAAIPPFDRSRPYQQIPTQYSLHVMHADGRVEHREFLGEGGRDPRRELAERMLADIPRGSCTVAYNTSFEKGRIIELAELFPDLREGLLDIVRAPNPSPKDRERGVPVSEEGDYGLVDLMEPFRNGDVYLPAQGGSYSIKHVLPALYPDDPSLDYGNLESNDPGVPVVRKGDAAAAAWLELGDPSHGEAWTAAMRRNLLQYCELDTWAMVKVYRALVEMAGGKAR